MSKRAKKPPARSSPPAKPAARLGEAAAAEPLFPADLFAGAPQRALPPLTPEVLPAWVVHTPRSQEAAQSSDAAQPRTRFFCFGLPKSGTTLLQYCLDCHPEVSCPSEHMLRDIEKGLKDLFSKYNRKLTTFDRRTGGQGAGEILEGTVTNIFRLVIIEMMDSSSLGKPIAGINDNSIIMRPNFYNSLFDNSKMIAIFRNPLDRALSAWFHNLRLAKEEDNRVHKELLERYEKLDGWIMQCAKEFDSAKSVSKYKGVFRKGTSGQESKLVSPRTKETVMEKHGEMMAEFGYSI
jgi:hypothetical protein